VSWWLWGCQHTTDSINHPKLAHNKQQALVPVVVGAGDHPAIAAELQQQLERLEAVVAAIAAAR